jgi:hypothetical protein
MGEGHPPVSANKLYICVVGAHIGYALAWGGGLGGNAAFVYAQMALPQSSCYGKREGKKTAGTNYGYHPSVGRAIIKNKNDNLFTTYAGHKS